MRRNPSVKCGDVFGRWTALEDGYSARRCLIRCRCECGSERRVDAGSLSTGNSKSCGCLRLEIQRAPRTQGYIKAGERSGRWVALKDTQFARDKVLCRCDCGTEKQVWGTSFRHGRTQSCGCLASELTTARNTTHGLRHHPLYGHWKAMVGRCTNPRQPGYADYGGRGITVCDRWRTLPAGLLNFIADMGAKPGPAYSVERIDNDGDYEPENCRWATQAEQCANMRPRATQVQLEILRAENLRLTLRVAELEALAGPPDGGGRMRRRRPKRPAA